MANYKRIFLDGYSYFITVVTHQRNPILIDNLELLRSAFKNSKSKYEYRIEAIVILPDHFHMIISPQNALEYPKIVSAIKRDNALKNPDNFLAEFISASSVA